VEKGSKKEAAIVALFSTKQHMGKTKIWGPCIICYPFIWPVHMLVTA